MNARHVFHVGPGTPYHVENSRRGIELAVARGFRGIDLDVNVTADRIMVNTHWARPMLRDGFRPPKGSGIPLTARVDQLAYADVRLLRTRQGFVIHRLADQLVYASAAGLELVEVDAKRTHGITRPRLWRELADASPVGLEVVVKCVTTHPEFYAVMRAAKAAGFPTLALIRGPIRDSWLPVIDATRSRRDTS